jgi:hypothetical protein
MEPFNFLKGFLFYQLRIFMASSVVSLTSTFLNFIEQFSSIFDFSLLTFHFSNTFAQTYFMPEQPQQPQNQLNIEISEEVAEGSYANLAIITHSHAEFVIDFVNVMPSTPKSRVKSRIIFTPMHAKRFMKAMQENIDRYETANGSIKDLEQIEIPLNFGGPTAQA